MFTVYLAKLEHFEDDFHRLFVRLSQEVSDTGNGDMFTVEATASPFRPNNSSPFEWKT